MAANILVAVYGPGISILNAFLFIGFDLTCRDSLHEAWKGRNLPLRMLCLIAAGSLLSWVLNRNAGPIAMASFTAFALSSTADTVMYQVLGRRSRAVRVNGSNVVSAMVDSSVFPLLAFGGIMPSIMAGQFAAKVLGGFLWSLILGRKPKGGR